MLWVSVFGTAVMRKPTAALRSGVHLFGVSLQSGALLMMNAQYSCTDTHRAKLCGAVCTVSFACFVGCQVQRLREISS